ncbi:hypothetical protein KIP88_43765 [Bradyrhizobium sp. SRL28]|uniref:hypothetical protein n=1 Tax=Bradyrhizobium sp. SRL28 TaxID=2836178 RepID=UPI001BDEC858|nr:hypothetical protein [Bradyrhizobium sp. SRL28]MBT1517255.1 hypothetical protein [Bradyrhizobium sp. SRL28]
MVNTLRLVELWHDRRRNTGLHSDKEWDRIRQLAQSLAQRLTRTIEGEHFFFVGCLGARATAAAITDLATEIGKVAEEWERSLKLMLPTGDQPINR